MPGASIIISGVNPIALTAVVSTSGGGYTVEAQYNVPSATTVEQITDNFVTPYPSSVTVNVTSSTVPSGYWLTTTGDGSWTLNSASSITGVFTVGASTTTRYEFNVVVTNGSVSYASDPRLILKKLMSDPEDRHR